MTGAERVFPLHPFFMPFVNLALRLQPIIHVAPVPTAPLMPEILRPLGDLFLEADILVYMKNCPTFFPIRCCLHIWALFSVGFMVFVPFVLFCFVWRMLLLFVLPCVQ